MTDERSSASKPDPTKVGIVLDLIETLGIDGADLLAALQQATPKTSNSAPTLDSFIDTVLPTLSAGTKRGYTTHFNRLRHGVCRQCSCTCDTCLD